MSAPPSTYFDQAAATWDDNPVQVALMRAVVEAILPRVRPTPRMDLLDAEAAATVHHHGFDRQVFKAWMNQAGFQDLEDATVHTIRKPVAGGGERDFSVFLITGRREQP